MKILFISFFVGNPDTGGKMCSNRNLNSLKRLYGDNNVFLISIYRSPKTENQNKLLWNIKKIFTDVFEVGFGGLSSVDKIKIMNKIEELNIDTVFVDSSLLGILCRKIKLKKPDIKIVTFFHNVEYKFFIQEILKKWTYFLSYRILLAYVSEKLACKYSDKIISLNQRDDNMLVSLYSRRCDMLIPISIENSYNENPSDNSNDIKTGLFVGSYFFPNVHGIKWFIHHVLPYVKMKLIIVGKDMDKIKRDIPDDNLKYVEIYSSVPNLTEYYEKADFVVLPIFLGGGMKVKTAEALMFGKFLIGTTEAFVGYEINNSIGVCCDKKEDMIKTICNFKNHFKFNQASRQLFLDNYSFESSLNKFQRVLS